jgi:hypothetical protein
VWDCRSESRVAAGIFGAAVALVSVLAWPDIVEAQTLPVAASQSEVCDSDEDDEAMPVPLWKRFAWEGACIEVSGSLQATYQA